MSTLSIAHFYRRDLPHIAARERALFITFTTYKRWRLPPGARTIALRHVVHGHSGPYFIHVAVVMPDHVHVIMTLPHTLTTHARSLAGVMKSIKGVSARRINQLLGRREHVWHLESYDHVIRRSERFKEICDYVIHNPVRAGMVTAADDYQWVWRAWIEGRSGADRSVCSTA